LNDLTIIAFSHFLILQIAQFRIIILMKLQIIIQLLSFKMVALICQTINWWNRKQSPSCWHCWCMDVQYLDVWFLWWWYINKRKPRTLVFIPHISNKLNHDINQTPCCCSILGGVYHWCLQLGLRVFAMSSCQEGLPVFNGVPGRADLACVWLVTLSGLMKMH
jgi:hypothetical protein